MALGEVIYSVLSNDANVTGIVGNNEAADGVRIFPDRVKYKEGFPLIVYTIDSEEPEDDKDGVSDLDVADLSVFMFTDTYTQGSQLSGFVRSALDGYSGTVSGTTIDRISFTNRLSPFDEQAEKYVVVHEYDVRIKR